MLVSSLVAFEDTLTLWLNNECSFCRQENVPDASIGCFRVLKDG